MPISLYQMRSLWIFLISYTSTLLFTHLAPATLAFFLFLGHTPKLVLTFELLHL